MVNQSLRIYQRIVYLAAESSPGYWEEYVERHTQRELGDPVAVCENVNQEIYLEAMIK
jgi:hypothetical protein